MEEDATQVLLAIFGEDIASEDKKNSEALLDQCKDTQPVKTLLTLCSDIFSTFFLVIEYLSSAM